MTETDRFYSKVRITSGCWSWLAGKNNKGYGKFYSSRLEGSAHRYAYERFFGRIPEGLHIDHLCRNRSCVNPAHLEPVTARENTMRGVAQTHCIRGHEYSGANLEIYKDGLRRCRPCRSARRKERRETSRAEAGRADWAPRSRALSYGVRFVEAARRRLTPELFEELIAEAKEEAAS